MEKELYGITEDHRRYLEGVRKSSRSLLSSEMFWSVIILSRERNGVARLTMGLVLSSFSSGGLFIGGQKERFQKVAQIEGIHNKGVAGKKMPAQL
jgi:hypothetical protein